MKKRTYVGLATTFHDSALAIVNSDGELVFAEATERYMQDKRAYNIPPDHIFRSKQILKQYCDPASDIVLAHSWLQESDSDEDESLLDIQQFRKQMEAQFEHPEFLKREFANYLYLSHFMKSNRRNAGKGIKRQLGLVPEFSEVSLTERYFDHHLTHAATACYSSPFEEGICLIVDAGGEAHSSYSVYQYRNGMVKRVDESPREPTGSLGIFFSWVCQACGFDLMGNEEWKVMGLAPYGELDADFYRECKNLINFEGIRVLPWSNERAFKFLEFCSRQEPDTQANPLNAANRAYTGQTVFEEIYFALINAVFALGYSKNLILGGGCSLNSTANGKISSQTPFKNIHIYSAPADDGNAIGAAWLAWLEDNATRYENFPSQRANSILSPYLGSDIRTESFANLKRFAGIPQMKEYPGRVHEKAAQLLADNKIIGWLQGRAEFGPRALGNRSILASPAYPDIKTEINRRVKFREEFRPFAPSILHEAGPEFFKNYQESPYMERTLEFHDHVRERIPGVVHTNNSGRLQSVKREWNQKYYDLLKAFYALTDIPILLNTSFNIMHKPIIHSVEDALGLFYTTGLDALVIDDIVIEKYSA
ncbi:carbamoyltransferase [Alteromonadaceae bacterium 2753L.S.0a.02]|nr:carbamoyltransferase [Alteromonadaceae bacterium 2753L.S.0a.02]